MGENKLVNLTLIGFLCFVPFVLPFHKAPIGSFSAEFASVTLFIALLAVLGLTWRPGSVGAGSSSSIPAPAMLLVPLLLFGVAVLQRVGGSSPTSFQFAWELIYLSLFAASIIVGVCLKQFLGARQAGNALALGFFVASVVTTLAQFVQCTSFGEAGTLLTLPRPRSGRIYGNLPQANHVATLICCGYAALLYFYLSNRLKFGWMVGFAATLCTGLALTGSRTGLLGLLLTLFLMAVVHWKTQEKSRLVKVIVVTSVLFVASDWVVGHYLISSMTSSGTGITRFSSGEQTAQRLMFWSAAWQTFLSHPILGVGFQGFRIAQFDLAEKWSVIEQSNNAHNLLLQALCEWGLAGALAICLPALVWLVSNRRGLFSPDGFVSLNVVAVLMLHSMVEFPLWYTMWLIPFGLSLGILTNRGIANFGAAAVHRSLRFVGLVSAALTVSVLVSYLGVAPLFDSKATLSESKRIELLEAAPSSFWFGDLGELAYSQFIVPEEKNKEKALALNSRVLTTFVDPNVVFRQSVFLAMNGRNDEAYAAFRRISIFFEPYTCSAISGLNSPELEHISALMELRGRVKAEFQRYENCVIDSRYVVKKLDRS